eukprot:364899-Chlamydomonas_euryale.AAC.13
MPGCRCIEHPSARQLGKDGAQMRPAADRPRRRTHSARAFRPRKSRPQLAEATRPRSPPLAT